MYYGIFQTYSVKLIAETSGGNVSALSDGVTIVTEDDTLDGVSLYDGLPCDEHDADGRNCHHSCFDEFYLVLYFFVYFKFVLLIARFFHFYS